MNTLTDGSFSCSCLSSCWFSFELSGRCIQSLSSLFGVVLGSCIVCAKPWIITTMKEGPPKKGGQVRDSQKKKYIRTHTVRIHHFVVPLCVVKGEKQSFEGQGSVPPRGCPIFFNPDDLDVFGYSLNSGLPDERVLLMKCLTIIRCRCVSSYGL